MSKLKNIVYLSREQKEELFDIGTITVIVNDEEVTVTYSDDDIYIVPQMWEADGEITANYYIKDATGATRLNITNQGRVIATEFVGIGTMLTELNANNISGGTINFNRLPKATEYDVGAVKGSDTITIDEEGSAHVNDDLISDIADISSVLNTKADKSTTYTKTETDSLLGGKVSTNTAITGATKTKITYDSKGLVTAGADLIASDIPNLSADKITSGTLGADRIPTLAQSKITNLSTTITDINTAIQDIVDGTTVVGKATKDDKGRNIEETYIKDVRTSYFPENRHFYVIGETFDDNVHSETYIELPLATTTIDGFLSKEDKVNLNSAYTDTSNAKSTNTINTIVKRDGSGNFSAGTISANLSGNASTATTLETSRSIAISGGATGTATSFNGESDISIPITSVSEAFLTWGGKNLASTYGPIDAAMVGELGANRLAFMNPSAITIEYSTDGGVSWVDYGSSDASKINLFNGNGAMHTIGKNTVIGTNITNYQLRVSINTAFTSLYTALNKFVILISTSGSSGSWVTIDGRTRANSVSNTDTWTTFADSVYISGWSGYNVINTPEITTWGNTDAHYQQVRFTFGNTGYNPNYIGLNIISILGFGGVGWSTPSNLAKKGNMFTYDHLQNVAFPGNVNVASGKTFQINGNNLSYGDVGAAPLSHNHTIGYFSTSTSSNLNETLGTGQFSWTNATTNTPLASSYGQGINIVSSGTVHNNTNNWITQLGFGTNMTSAFFRGKSNSNPWGVWNTLYHTGNKPTATDVGARASNWVPSYSDITGTKPPTDAQKNVQSDWTASSGDAQILNKPTNLNQFTNGPGYATETWAKDNLTYDLYLEGNTTGTAGIWTVSDDRITEYKHGMSFQFKIGIAGASTTTLDINGLGAKTVYRGAATKLSTHYGVNYVINLVYDATLNGTSEDPGCFIVQGDYDSNTIDRLQRQDYVMLSGNTLYRYKLVGILADGTYAPLFITNKTSTTVVTGTWEVSSQEFMIGTSLEWYSSTTTVNPGTRFRDKYPEMYFDVRYNINVAALTANKSVYLVGTPGPNGGFVMSTDTYYSQDLPTTDDGKLYWYIGNMYDTSAIRFTLEKPVYQYKDGKIQLYTLYAQKAGEALQADKLKNSVNIWGRGFDGTSEVFGKLEKVTGITPHAHFSGPGYDIGEEGKRFSTLYVKTVNAVTLHGELEDESVTEDNIENGAITNDKIATGAVTNDKILSKILGYNGISNDKIENDFIIVGDPDSGRVSLGGTLSLDNMFDIGVSGVMIRIGDDNYSTTVGETGQLLTTISKTNRTIGWVSPSSLTVSSSTTATKLSTARSLKTALNSTEAVTFDGSGNQDAIPVTGTLGVANGGIGLSSVTANSYLKGNGTGSLTPRTYAEVKTDLGLNKVNNTTDAEKPVSDATLTALNNKVDKITGKGLSTEDYTSTEKTKLSGIEIGAQVNTVTSVAGKTGAVLVTASDVGAVDLVSNQNNIAGNKTLIGQTALQNSAVPLYIRRLNNAGAVYAAAIFERGTAGTPGVNNEGLGFYFQSRDTAGNMDHAGLIGGRLAIATADAEIGEIVLNPSYQNDDPYNNPGMRVRARALDKADVYTTGDFYSGAGVSGTSGNKVATETFVTDKGYATETWTNSTKANKENSIYYVVGNITGTAGVWTGTIEGLTAYYVGLTIAYKIGVDGASPTTLNINNGTTDLGAIPVQRNDSAHSTQLPKSTVVILTYDGTYWKWADYSNNESYVVRYNQSLLMKAPASGYALIAQDITDGTYRAVYKTNTNNDVNNKELNISGPLLYNSSSSAITADTARATSVYAGTGMTASYIIRGFTGGVQYAPVYLVGTVGPNGGFIPYYNANRQSYQVGIPTDATANREKLYWYLGYMYSETSIRLELAHPCYYMDDEGGFKPFSTANFEYLESRINTKADANNKDTILGVINASAVTAGAQGNGLVSGKVIKDFVDGQVNAVQERLDNIPGGILVFDDEDGYILHRLDNLTIDTTGARLVIFHYVIGNNNTGNYSGYSEQVDIPFVHDISQSIDGSVLVCKDYFMYSYDTNDIRFRNTTITQDEVLHVRFEIYK